MIAAISALALAIVSAGCYNNPHVSQRAPGQGGDTSRGPTVGPGTIPGGSTAGRQPAAKSTEKHAPAEPAKH